MNNKLLPQRMIETIFTLLFLVACTAQATPTAKAPATQAKPKPTEILKATPALPKPTDIPKATVIPPTPTPAPAEMPAAAPPLPDFIYTVRAYIGAGYDDFQRRTMYELGLEYVQGLVDFSWPNLEPSDDAWKWAAADAQMDQLAQSGLKVIAFVICPKAPGLPWDDTITRSDPRFVAEYNEFAYEIVKRYHDHLAWSGLVTVWGGSADVWDHDYPATDPEVVVPLLNAAYDGIKQADPHTLVVSFNFATTAHSIAEWEEYHTRAFALAPRFDWYGAHSHGVPVTLLESPGAYTGVVGLLNVRRFLDAHGYADKPLWLNEGGMLNGAELGGLPEQTHAEQVVETYIVARTLDIHLKGWVYFEYFDKSHVFEGSGDAGLMSALDQHDPPQPRPAWYALQTLIQTVDFFDYDLSSKISGEYSQSSPPFVYLFTRRDRPDSKLWIVFSPSGVAKGEPVVQEVTLPIAPATQATLITMLGEQSTLTADAAGNVTVTSTSSPLYLKVGE